MEDLFTLYSDILKGKGNPYHDERGRFTSGPSGGATKKPKTSELGRGLARNDPLAALARRYRVKSGLAMPEFIREVHSILRPHLPQTFTLTRAMMNSAPKYIAFARLHNQTSDSIERAFAIVTDKYA